MNGPARYAVLQGAIGVVQFAIGAAMLSGFRATGTWGPFELPSQLRPTRNRCG